MMLDHRQHHLETLRSGVGLLLFPLLQITSLPRTGGDWLAEEFATRRQLQEENVSLKTQQLLLHAEVQKLEAIEMENIRLRKLLDSSTQIGERVLIAEIMAVDLNPFSRQIVLNKGSRNNVYAGQPILDAKGVMGQIVEVTPFTSMAVIISDPSHAIPITVNRNGLRGIAIGTGNANLLDIPHIPNNADIRVGDLLVTSGLGGRFPPNYPVATVTVVTKDPRQRFAKIQAESAAKLDRSREALLVWRRDELKTEDLSPDEVECDPEHENCEPLPVAPTEAINE